MKYECSTRLSIEEKVSCLKKENKNHYVYILHKPDGTPFYVGKGQNSRIFAHEVEARGTSRRSHKLNLIRKIIQNNESILYSIPYAGDCHERALVEEMKLIALLGRYDQNKNYFLTNQTDGGEGSLNPSEDSKEKHRQTLSGIDDEDPDVAIANKFLSEYCKVASNPIKSINKYKASISTLHKNRGFIGKKPRNAGALVAMAVAQSVILSLEVTLSRRFKYNNIGLILENGCGRDMIVNGMIYLVDETPKHEKFVITKSGFEYILQIYEFDKLISYGLLI